MKRKTIKLIIFLVVLPLFVLDASLLVAAQVNSAADDSDRGVLAQFQQQLQSQKAAQPVAAQPISTPSNLGVVSPSQDNGIFSAAPAQAVPSSTESVAQMMGQRASEDQGMAFQAVKSQAMPMTPDQIIEFKRRLAATQRAAAQSPETPPRPVTSSKFVSLAPGATPPIIRLSAGFISTLVFIDAAGDPWPIQSIDNGNPDAFNISWDKKNNILMIQAKKSYTYGNLAVNLKGATAPVMLTLIPGQKVIDYRIDLRVSGLAPNAKGSLMGTVLPHSTSNELLNVLDGIPPAHAKALNVEGGYAKAWTVGGKLFLRTRFTLLSPGWVGSMRSPDGTYAYELQETPTLLISQYGKPTEVRVGGD